MKHIRLITKGIKKLDPTLQITRVRQGKHLILRLTDASSRTFTMPVCSTPSVAEYTVHHFLHDVKKWIGTK